MVLIEVSPAGAMLGRGRVRDGEAEGPDRARTDRRRLRRPSAGGAAVQGDDADRTRSPGSRYAHVHRQTGGAKVAPGIDLVARLAKALETSISDLLPEAEPPDPLPVLREQGPEAHRDAQGGRQGHAVDAGPAAGQTAG